MSRKDYKTIIGFSDQWFVLGVATEETLILAGRDYEASGDDAGEHYRYGAFLRYIGQHRPLAPSVAEALYELGNADPDYAMGGNIMADIVDLPECPPSIIAKALVSDRQHLVRKANRNRLLSELQPFITVEAFDRLFHDGDGVVHLGLLKHVNLSQEQLQLLAVQGANKQTRRMATATLERQNKSDEQHNIKLQAAFLDRDGVLNPHIPGGYLLRAEDVTVLPGAAAAVRRLNDAGVRVIVVSNQQGVGKGLMTQADLEAIERRMGEMLEQEAGAFLDGSYYSVELASENSPRRKPQPGMLLEAAAEFGLTLARTVFAGDSATDIAAGHAAGVGYTALLLSGGIRAYSKGDLDPAPDLVFPDLASLVDWVLEQK